MKYALSLCTLKRSKSRLQRLALSEKQRRAERIWNRRQALKFTRREAMKQVI